MINRMHLPWPTPRPPWPERLAWYQRLVVAVRQCDAVLLECVTAEDRIVAYLGRVAPETRTLTQMAHGTHLLDGTVTLPLHRLVREQVVTRVRRGGYVLNAEEA